MTCYYYMHKFILHVAYYICTDAVNLVTNVRGDFEVKKGIFLDEVTRAPSLRDLGLSEWWKMNNDTLYKH